MSSIHPNEIFEFFLQKTELKTVGKYAYLSCNHCKSYAFLSLREYNRQVKDLSEHYWICPICGKHCIIDEFYASRMLAN